MIKHYNIKDIKIVLKRIAYQLINRLFGVRNIILFKGQSDFDGNARALYEYLISNGYDNKYRFVWHVSNKYEFDSTHCKCISNEKKSLRNYYYQTCAKYIFYDNVCPVPTRGKGQSVIYLCHGCPPLKYAKNHINVDHATAALITNEEIRDKMAYIRNFPPEKLFVSGMPRNDAIFNNPKKYKDLIGKQYDKIVLWMPTFRKSDIISCGELRVDSTVDYLYGLPLIHKYDDLKRINDVFREKGMLLIIKPHPHAEKSGIDEVRLSNVIIWTQDYLRENDINIYSYFADTDALISDYSSVVFDYMLTDHPIAYIIDDMDEYKLGFAYDNVFDYMPGDKIKKFDHLLAFIEDVADGVDKHKEERRKINKWANKYQDGDNCKRIVEMFNI